MALTNAERQRRYRRRLKARAATGGDAILRLNQAYSAAAAAQRAESFRKIADGLSQAGGQAALQALKEIVRRLPPPTYEWTIEDWCGIASQLGASDEESLLREVRDEAIHSAASKASAET
jgi:hypothetical protein